MFSRPEVARPRPQVLGPRPRPGVTRSTPAGLMAKALSIKAKDWSHMTKTEIFLQNYNHIAYKIISV